MANACTPELVAAISNAGGLGSFGAGYKYILKLFCVYFFICSCCRHCAEALCKYGTSKLYVYHNSFKRCYAYHIIIVVFSYEKSLKKGVLIKISA